MSHAQAVPSERGEVDILGMSAASPPTEPSQPSARSSMYSNDLLNPSGPTQGTAVNSKISPDIESLFGNAPHAMQQQVSFSVVSPQHDLLLAGM